MADKNQDVGYLTRRDTLFSAAAALGVPAALALASSPAAAQSVDSWSSTCIPVGESHLFKNIQEALDSIVDAGPGRRYTVALDPGIYDLMMLGRPVELKPFVSIVGFDRHSTVIVVSGQMNIRAAHFSAIERVTVLSSGHGLNGGAIESRIPSLTDFFLTDCFIFLNGPGAAFVSTRYIARAEMRDLMIVTASVGLAFCVGGTFVSIHDVNIYLTGNAGPHIGILAQGYLRLYVYGGRIATGYGYPEINDPAQPMIGVHVDVNSKGRVHLHGVWSICRSEGILNGIPVNCVRVDSKEGWVRLFGGFFQSEIGDLRNGETLANPGGGRIEIYGSRSRNYGEGPVYGSSQIGRQLLTVANHGVVLDEGMSGLVLLDASGGPFSVVLPNSPPETCQFLLKKIDTTTNVVTVQPDGWRLIDGLPRVTLTEPYSRLHLRYCLKQYLIVA